MEGGRLHWPTSEDGHVQLTGEERKPSARWPLRCSRPVIICLKTAPYTRISAPSHFDQRAKEKHTVRLICNLENLGFEVHIAPKAAKQAAEKLLICT
jgi:hypothetical protein